MPPHSRRVPASAINGFVDRARIDVLLAPWVPDAQDRAFVVRCLLDEGPAHHRGANYVILALLGELLARLPGPPPRADTPATPVPMRLPPHMKAEEGEFPLGICERPVELLAPKGSRAFEAMVDCLGDGPPQHALANAATVAILEALLERAGAWR